MFTSVALAAAMLLTQNAQQFDLVCTSTAPGSNHVDRYHIDISRMVWCHGDCRDPKPIIRVNNAELVLNEHGVVDSWRTVVNRLTGSYQSERYNARLRAVDLRVSQQCTRADFTPIPATQF
jgi:hypothetical protein